MQGDVVEYCDEVEPRRMPKPATAFDSRPFPTVPEVSLILEQQKKMERSTENNTLQVTSSITHDAAYKASESYTAWKEKQFPQRSTISPNRSHQIYSSTHNASALQDPQNYKNFPKSHNQLDNRDYNTKYQSLEYDFPRTHQVPRVPYDSSTREYNALKGLRNESPNRYNIQKNHEHFSDSNRYTSNHSSNHHELNYHNTDSHINRNCVPRYNVEDGRISPIVEHLPHRLYETGFEACNMKQRPRIYRSASFSNTDNYTHRHMPLEHDYDLKHSKSLEPYHYNSQHSCSHSHSGCCSGNHNNTNIETETVKNLLQVITSQNEQIKNLQKQVERLLKLHEQTLKERKQCTCQPNGIAHPNIQLYDQSQPANGSIVHNNFVKDNEKCFPDLKLQDDKNKKTILEQKVSIGVMTSFELKVQNNPSSNADNQNQSKQKSSQDKVVSSLDHTSNILKTLVNDTGEMIRKKKSNYYNPTALENISEGSESHMSSFRQSHLCSDTTKQSTEAQDSTKIPYTESHNENSKQNEIIELHSESRQNLNRFSNSNHRNLDNLDYGIEESTYRDTNEIINEAANRYNFQYDEIRSSPQEALKEKQCNQFRSDEPLVRDIKKMKNTKCDNLADECLSLSSSDLDVEDLSPPSPEPSIHLDMQEFSDEGGSLPPQQAPKPGWTLYNNVLDQVNQILQNSPLNDDIDNESNDGIKNNKKREYDNNVIMDTVKAATLEQLTKLGISFSDNVDQREPAYNKKVVFDASSYQRQGPETHFATASASIETNTSMHMKALAMKYFNDEQLADFQKSRSGTMKHSSSGMQNTNMSFATMHYLQRYHLLPGTNSSPKKEIPREHYRVSSPGMNERIVRQTAERREPSPHRYGPFTGTSKVSYPSKILDISTLKQQPKLL
ncbi:GATA zinc finger domain-containing protein 14-like [Phymastichus coffea]|uniref:GATA zinc finger domain-containing protein 14-like n=1 Tax=Phymastichus coffea TaxID=108790 RepID=UPI00273C5D49|nr:GATA zinc finger domain-containing protein 14-like [Phymastichus coffea]